MEEFAIVDFETTGLSAGYDRPTEIAISILRNGKVAKSFCKLMNPGRSISSRIQSLTGISNSMVARAPSVAQVMHEAAEIVGARPLVAHNASFDRRFWHAELSALGLRTTNPFLCTMLLARRIYPHFYDHKLQSLRVQLGLPDAGRAHRAAADVAVTVELLKRMQADLASRYGVKRVTTDLLHRVQSAPSHRLESIMASTR